MITLDDLVALAQAPDLDNRRLASLTEQFETATPYGTRLEAKLDLIERLTGTRPEISSTGSCTTIVQNYVYLKGLGVKNIGRLVKRLPAVFGYNIAENMRPKVEYLKKLGVRNIGKFVERYPQVFRHSIAKNMQPKVDYLTRLGVKNIGKFVERSPAVFGYNIADRILQAAV